MLVRQGHFNPQTIRNYDPAHWWVIWREAKGNPQETDIPPYEGWLWVNQQDGSVFIYLKGRGWLLLSSD